MDYHKIDEPLRVREYGRNVQIMTERMLSESDPRRQSQMAHDIIRIMNTIAPAQKDLVDQKRKLWDNLYRISDYRLSPNVIPFRPPVPLRSQPPAHIPYQTKVSKYKPYGRNVELLIEKALAMPDSPERDLFILQIAQIMRSFLHNYSNGVTSDKVIFDHLSDLSGGKIRLSPEEINLRVNAAQTRSQNEINRNTEPRSERQPQGPERQNTPKHHSGHQIHRKKNEDFNRQRNDNSGNSNQNRQPDRRNHSNPNQNQNQNQNSHHPNHQNRPGQPQHRNRPPQNRNFQSGENQDRQGDNFNANRNNFNNKEQNFNRNNDGGNDFEKKNRFHRPK